ncbi:MAG TPA: carboxypeptidase-like regulatory domain-containing protein [Terriglobales bacterium]|nr:carboxypeptidase-like regulatory domain-containing protein [Terriglobales bacterium]
MIRSKRILTATILLAFPAAFAAAQSGYQTITVNDGGTITGSVKWSGPVPKVAPVAINKDPEVCDPQGQKKRDLERLVVAANGGVANTVVFLKDVTRGKAMDLPEARQFLNQKTCRYEPHVLLVPDNGTLQLKSSDPVLHTVHMSGASDYNLPFPFANQTVTRTMNREGLVDLRCNAGHVWMNAEMMVVKHPYYAVTDEDGNFKLTNVPPGEYEIEAWHEGWKVTGQGAVYDVMTQMRVQRPIFSDPMEWTKKVTVPANGSVDVKFMISDKRPEMASSR